MAQMADEKEIRILRNIQKLSKCMSPYAHVRAHTQNTHMHTYNRSKWSTARGAEAAPAIPGSGLFGWLPGGAPPMEAQYPPRFMQSHLQLLLIRSLPRRIPRSLQRYLEYHIKYMPSKQ